MIKLSPTMIKAIEEILDSGRRVEIVAAYDRRSGQRKVVTWAVSSKQKQEEPIV